MTYISNPVCCGFGMIDAVDGGSALARSAAFDANFSSAFKTLAGMSPAKLASVIAQVNSVVQKLPLADQNYIKINGRIAAQTVDPRGIPGLGQAAAAVTVVQAADWTSKLANIAGVIASITSLGLGVYGFVQGKKDAKADQARQDAQQAEAKRMNDEEIAARQANLASAKQRADAEEQKMQLNQQGLMVDAQGNVIKKPASSATTIGAVGAAAMAAFFLVK